MIGTYCDISPCDALGHLDATVYLTGRGDRSCESPLHAIERLL